MAANFAALRSKVELALAGRVAAPFNYRDRQEVVTVSSGIPEIDLLTGGLPRGALTEIFGPSCSGRTSLLLSALSARTAQEEACALIDGGDAFDPHSAEAAGVELRKLLWVRCRNVEQTLRATDLLLQGGGFGLIAVDLTDIAPRLVRHVPLDSWFRFRRAVEDTPTVLVLLEQESNAKSCASLGLRLEAGAAGWSRMPVESVVGVAGPRRAEEFSRLPWGWLLEGTSARGEVSRSRVQKGNAGYFRGGFAAAPGTVSAGIFSTRMDWDFLSLPIAAKQK
jgi:recombination protein RecA